MKLFFSFVINLAYSNIFAAIDDRYKSENVSFISKVKQLNQLNLTGIDFGAQMAFEDIQLSEETINLLKEIVIKRSPFEKICLIKRILESISFDLTENFNKQHFLDIMKCPKTTADDLTAYFVFILIKLDLEMNLLSEINFLKIFSNYISTHNEYAYSLVTFEYSVEYIRNLQSNNFESRVVKKADLSKDQDRSKNDIRPILNELNSEFDSELEKISKLICENHLLAEKSAKSAIKLDKKCPSNSNLGYCFLIIFLNL